MFTTKRQGHQEEKEGFLPLAESVLPADSARPTGTKAHFLSAIGNLAVTRGQSPGSSRG